MNADLRPIRTAAEQALGELVHQRLVDRPVAGRIGELRQAAVAAFDLHGLPHRRIEEWKYTDLRAVLRTAPPAAGPADAASVAAAAAEAVAFPGARRLLFVNGRLVAASSDLADLETGLTVAPLDTILADGNPLAERIGALLPARYDGALALNTAYLGEGLVIHVAAGTRLARPLHVAHVFTGDAPAALYTRSLVVVEAGAKAALVESFSGPAGSAYLTNTASELYVGDEAHMDYLRLQEEGEAAIHLATLMAEIGRNAAFHAFGLTTGAALSRLSVYGRFAGMGSHVAVRGATLLKGRQHADATLLMDHAVGHCESREQFKTVLADESHGVFQGKVVVRPDAQKTDGRMMSQALLLGAFAEMDNKPELEIFADDVQCGHGATAGELDEDQLFYLESRGVPAAEAEALLVEAFVAEVVEHVEQEELRDVLLARAKVWLDARAAA